MISITSDKVNSKYIVTMKHGGEIQRIVRKRTAGLLNSRKTFNIREFDKKKSITNEFYDRHQIHPMYINKTLYKYKYKVYSQNWQHP